MHTGSTTDMESEVLTTSQAAKLLGISVRTAQLLVEGGSLKSWKTPGGHRRVYRADVLALMKEPNQAPPLSSANVTVLTAPARWPLYERALSPVSGYAVDAYSDMNAASFAIGSRLPAAVIVDLNDDTDARLSFLRSLAEIPALAHTRVVVVGGPDAAPIDSSPARAHIATPELVPDALRTLLADTTNSAVPIESVPSFPIAANEGQRLIALEQSGLVDTKPEASFDRLTWLASHALETPISLMTLLTPTRQVFKSRLGIDLTETPRSWAFCNQTILQRDVFAVENLALDKRFVDNPAVVGDRHFRFYAGAPVIDPNGFALGSVCVIDREPRKLNQADKRTLLSLAAIASDEVRLRSADRQLRWATSARDRQQKR